MVGRDSLWLIVISRANRDLEEHQAINYELCMILSRLSEELLYYVGCCQSLEQSKQTLLKHGPDIVGLKEQSLAIDLIALLVHNI